MTIFKISKNGAADEEVAELLKKTKTIAVVGLSHKEHRASHRVAKYLMENGYQVIPVNPKYREVLGQPCYQNLKSVPGHIDMVDIFRNIEAIPAIVEDAISVGAGSVWMQLGLIHEQAAEKARSNGLQVVMDKCTKIEHQRLIAKQT
ncbi:MAG: CoA-binding protein [Desulforhabdus sp.]|jgi:predicted CoA-binding protein|nr:CoA-binding protein [Desulforhabdus sp.]